MIEETAQLGREIEGSAGTVVFGNGVPAQRGEVESARGDVLYFRTEAGELLVVPVSSVAYYRFAGEES